MKQKKTSLLPQVYIRAKEQLLEDNSSQYGFYPMSIVWWAGAGVNRQYSGRSSHPRYGGLGWAVKFPKVRAVLPVLFHEWHWMWQGPGTRTPSNRSQHPNKVAGVIWNGAHRCEVGGGRRGFGVGCKNSVLKAWDGCYQWLWSFRKEEAHVGVVLCWESMRNYSRESKRWAWGRKGGVNELTSESRGLGGGWAPLAAWKLEKLVMGSSDEVC